MLAGGCSGTSDDETIGWSAQRLYGEAKDAMAGKDWPKAVKYLEKLEARYPYGRFAQQAQLEIAYCQWKDDDRAGAIASIDRFIKLYPNHASADYAWYLKGLINFSLQQNIVTQFATPDMTDRDPKASREAFDAFKEVVTRFPDSKYAEDAEARMHYLVNALASHEVHVARYYMKRGAYVAAINRAQSAVSDYQDVPAVEEALFILLRSYDSLGMTQLRDDTRRVMEKTYPKSEFLTRGFKSTQDPWWKFW